MFKRLDMDVDAYKLIGGAGAEQKYEAVFWWDASRYGAQYSPTMGEEEQEPEAASYDGRFSYPGSYALAGHYNKQMSDMLSDYGSKTIFTDHYALSISSDDSVNADALAILAVLPKLIWYDANAELSEKLFDANTSSGEGTSGQVVTARGQTVARFEPDATYLYGSGGGVFSCI